VLYLYTTKCFKNTGSNLQLSCVWDFAFLCLSSEKKEIFEVLKPVIWKKISDQHSKRSTALKALSHCIGSLGHWSSTSAYAFNCLTLCLESRIQTNPHTSTASHRFSLHTELPQKNHSSGTLVGVEPTSFPRVFPPSCQRSRASIHTLKFQTKACNHATKCRCSVPADLE
jgi:hypothetical protein